MSANKDGADPSAHAQRTPFEEWWWNEGSGMPPLPGEDAETHVHRVCKIAWEKAAYKAREERPIDRPIQG